MKIETNLRLALKSFCDQYKSKSRYDYREKDKLAVKLFLKTNAKARDLLKRYKEGQKAREMLDVDFGISAYDLGVSRRSIAVTAGVKCEPDVSAPSYHAIINQLVCATPEEGAKILNKLGVKWE